MGPKTYTAKIRVFDLKTSGDLLTLGWVYDQTSRKKKTLIFLKAKTLILAPGSEEFIRFLIK